MLDDTIIETTNIDFDGQLPSKFTFPLINFFSKNGQAPVSEVSEIDGTLDNKKLANDADTKLFDEIYQAFTFASDVFCDLDENQLKRAFIEAKILADSMLFGEELSPSVCVDPYGEFTFSHRSAVGYVDIGVRGEGELSYHVRNDVDPAETKFDDYNWVDYKVPHDLFTALQALRRNL